MSGRRPAVAVGKGLEGMLIERASKGLREEGGTTDLVTESPLLKSPKAERDFAVSDSRLVRLCASFSALLARRLLSGRNDISY